MKNERKIKTETNNRERKKKESIALQYKTVKEWSRKRTSRSSYIHLKSVETPGCLQTAVHQ